MGCGGRSSAIDEQRLSGRRSRVVLTPRRWCQVSRSNPRDDGGKKARSPGRARRKLLKPLRAGMPGCSGGPVVTNARVYYTPRAAAGASAPGIPHALAGGEFSITRAHRVAGMRRCIRASLRAIGRAFARPVGSSQRWFHHECATISTVIVRHRVGATRRPMTGSGGRSSIPEQAL